MKHDKNTPIPRATAKRLSLYYRIFKRFNSEKIERANSKQIADAIGIDSATVRRDFSYFGELGRRGFGYDVKTDELLCGSLNDKCHYQCRYCWDRNMGSALLNYRFHEHNKMKMVMAFDLDDHELINTKSKDGIPIYGISSIKEKAQTRRHSNSHPNCSKRQGSRSG